jgi:uncharacterized phage protein gp47/JayE
MTQPANVPLFTVQTKSKSQIRDDILRTLSNHLRGLGIANPNVGPTSDYYGIADGVANEICVGLANGVVNTNNLMPDQAGGAFLDRWLAIFKLARAGATQSQGVVTPSYSLAQGYTLIPLGAQLQDAAGLRYEVIAGGSYGPGNPPSTPPNLYVPVQAVDAGAATDHENGDQLTWITLIPYTGPDVTVGTPGGSDGLSGGNDSEATQDEPPRARLLDRLQNPPGGGNWADVAQWCRDSSPDVQQGAVYPALIGPATMFFAVCAAPQTQGVLSSTSKNRSLQAALISGTVVPYVQGKYPTRAAVIGASVANQPVDVSLQLSLPSAPTAIPAGPGGGWVDGTPWPSSIGAAAPCVVSAAPISSIQFQVNATTPPVPGVSHIAYVSTSNWQLFTALVTGVTGTPGAYVITIDTPWPNLAADFAASAVAIFPQAVQQLNYLAAAFSAFANLGPGEWSNSAIVLFRGFRHPQPSLTWPSALDANFLRTVENSGTEVASAQWLYRSVTPVNGIYAPTVPPIATITPTEPFVLLSPPPNHFVPRSISWYAQ